VTVNRLRSGGGTYHPEYDGPGEEFHPEREEFHFCRVHLDARTPAILRANLP
jgi:hypothetical protein